MDTRKVKILMAVTPPGFSTAIIVNDANGIPQKEEQFNICHPGDVIEISKELADNYIANGIAGPASASERVTKKPNYGAFENAESGPEKQNPVPAKADGSDI